MRLNGSNTVKQILGLLKEVDRVSQKRVLKKVETEGTKRKISEIRLTLIEQ